MHDFGLLIARLLLGVPFIIWGIMKLRGGEARLVPVLAGLGLPDATMLAYLVGLCELVGGIGVSGASEEQDGVCARAGLLAIGADDVES